MENKGVEQLPAHWIMANIGKRILRPGGKVLTLQMIENLKINGESDVVEFSPGLGVTSNVSLKKMPKSYTAVEQNPFSQMHIPEQVGETEIGVINASVSETGLDSESVNVVYGEAFLTMQSPKVKEEIMHEANRILKKSGRFGIHEICLDNHISEQQREILNQELSDAIKSSVTPLTVNEWIQYVEKQGFQTVRVIVNDLRLLKLRKIYNEEGFLRTVRIVTNVMLKSPYRKRIFGMKKVFSKHSKYIKSLIIIAEKV